MIKLKANVINREYVYIVSKMLIYVPIT